MKFQVVNKHFNHLFEKFCLTIAIWQLLHVQFGSTLDAAKRKQSLILQGKVLECLEANLTQPPIQLLDSELYCPLVWDGLYCWPYVKAGTVHEAPCPDYVAGFRTDGVVTRACMPDGTWFFNEDVNDTWSNYTDCFHRDHTKFFINGTLIGEYLPLILSVSRVGYAFSLSTLLIAFFVLAFIKRLRCPRNNLHMHLFVSFMFRAFMTLLKSNLFIAGVGLPANVVFDEGRGIHFNTEERWDCKVLITFWQYFLMANYCWILMEGLYLHNLIFLALLSDNSGILMYILLGWGLPILFIVPWALVRVFFEDTLCWTTHANEGIFWIIRGPITVSIVVNFVFFLNITRILFLKLKSSYTPDSRKTRYKKLARSTLVLVPLFGVHYTIFLAMSTTVGLDELTEVIWLFCDQFFTAFQGFFVAVLYCFMNSEVQGELRKKWQRWNLKRGQISSSRSSLATQSLTYFSSRPRNSLHSLTTSAVIDPFKKNCCSMTPSPNMRRTDKLSCLHRNKTPSPKGERHNEMSSCTTYSYCPKLSDSSLNCEKTMALLPCPSPGDTGSSSYDRLTSPSPTVASTPVVDRLSLPTIARSDTAEDARLLASPISECAHSEQIESIF